MVLFVLFIIIIKKYNVGRTGLDVLNWPFLWVWYGVNNLFLKLAGKQNMG